MGNHLQKQKKTSMIPCLARHINRAAANVYKGFIIPTAYNGINHLINIIINFDVLFLHAYLSISVSNDRRRGLSNE